LRAPSRARSAGRESRPQPGVHEARSLPAASSLVRLLILRPQRRFTSERPRSLPLRVAATRTQQSAFTTSSSRRVDARHHRCHAFQRTPSAAIERECLPDSVVSAATAAPACCRAAAGVIIAHRAETPPRLPPEVTRHYYATRLYAVRQLRFHAPASPAAAVGYARQAAADGKPPTRFRTTISTSPTVLPV